MIVHTTAAVLTPYLSAAEGGEEQGHTNAYLVGVSVFIALTVLLLATLSFNRDR